jgi:hypothetical protein
VAGQAGTTIVWAGVVGGTMVQFSRVSFAHLHGGLALVGMASSDSDGTFSTFGNRPGIGLHLSQHGTPHVGTGYLTLDEILCSDMTTAIRFGTDPDDDNADTSVIDRGVIARCDDGIVIRHRQGLGYRFAWLHGISVTGSLVRSEGGGAVEIGSLHASACGTATPDGAAVDAYLLDCDSTTTGYLFKVALFRIENGSVRAAATRSHAVHLQIDVFEEANTTNLRRTLFFQAGGTLQILGGRLHSHAEAAGNDERPIVMTNDAAARPPRLVLSEVSLPVFEWSRLFLLDPNVVADISVISPRDHADAAGETRHSRLERGRVVLGGTTTDGHTETVLDPMMRLGGSSYVHSYGPRVPGGTSVVRLTVVGDRAGPSPTVLTRRVTLRRDLDGVADVVAAQTIGPDLVQGSDRITDLVVAPGTHTLTVQVCGSASTRVSWRAVLELEAVYAPSPDY